MFDFYKSDYEHLYVVLKNSRYDLYDLMVDEKGLSSQSLFEVYYTRRDGQLNQDGSPKAWKETENIGRFYLSPFPGNCGIVVIHDMYLNKSERGTRNSNLIREGKEKLCKKLGYSRILATTQMSNLSAVGNFFKSSYRFVDTFTNKRTENLIGIGIKEVK